MFLEKLNPVAKKSLFAFIIAFFCTTLILLIYFLGTPGKILGLVVFSIIAIFTIYEFCKPFNIPLWTKIIIPLSTIFIILTPLNNEFLDFINTPNKDLISLDPNSKFANILIDLVREQFKFSIANIPGIGFPILAGMIFIPCLFAIDKKKILSTFLILLVGIILITFSIKFLLYLTILQFSLVLTLVAAVILTDTFAYFGGKLFGNHFFKRKLAPKISPNKTIEGAIAGYVISAMFLFLIFGLNFAQVSGGINFGKIGLINPLFLLLTVPPFIPLIAILGDLLFSYIKRKLEVKDFSNLIPSHGGILDRFDSLILVIFIFSFFISFA